MGDKSAAKALMAKAGVPLTPGYHGDQQEPSFLREQADAIGYPVLIKASAGGGGKGMRKVERSEDFVDALASCQREAASAFGNDHVLVEKYVERPRHIEIRCSATATVMRSTCSNATARCSAATRRCWKKRRPRA